MLIHFFLSAMIFLPSLLNHAVHFSCRGYCAPEILKNVNVIRREFDIYSLGVIILQILTGRIYESQEVQKERSQQVLKDVSDFFPYVFQPPR